MSNLCLIVVLLKQKSNLRAVSIKSFPLSRVECGATLRCPGESQAKHHLDQEEQGPGGPGPLYKEQDIGLECLLMKRNKYGFYVTVFLTILTYTQLLLLKIVISLSKQNICLQSIKEVQLI